MASFESITHDILPLEWPESSSSVSVEEEEQERLYKPVKLSWSGEEGEQKSQTTALEQPAPMAVEMVALQCFGAGLAIGMMMCYFLRSNKE